MSFWEQVSVATGASLPDLWRAYMRLKKWRLLDSHPDRLRGDPCIAGTRLSTVHVYQYCAGSDSDAHIKMFRENWPYVTEKAIKQAIAFERKRRGI